MLQVSVLEHFMFYSLNIKVILKLGGMLELSTDYSWTSADERLTATTPKGVYDLRRMERLRFMPKQKSVMGVPIEKVLPSRPAVQMLYDRNNFVPTMANNQVVSQGFFDEINAFVETVEGRKKTILTHPDDLFYSLNIKVILKQ